MKEPSETTQSQTNSSLTAALKIIAFIGIFFACSLPLIVKILIQIFKNHNLTVYADFGNHDVVQMMNKGQKLNLLQNQEWQET